MIVQIKRSQVSLAQIASTYTLRCDAKHFSDEFVQKDAATRSAAHFELGDFLPTPFAKGVQPAYLDLPGEDTVPVINTLSVQRLVIQESDCRHISKDDFDALDVERQLRMDDVLLTVDGGVSIGKTALFDKKSDFTVDAHVCILRPVGLEPLSLVYLLASPLGQYQFKRAESGASGQTAVTEEDIRRFVFPSSILARLDEVVEHIENERKLIQGELRLLTEREAAAWAKLDELAE